MFAPSDYAFDLPDALIAQQPAATREASRLLHLRPDGSVGDHTFADIVELLPRDAVVIANDTRVIPARVIATKRASGGKLELLFLEPLDAEEAAALRDLRSGYSAWRCMVRGRINTITVDVGIDEVQLLSSRADQGSAAGSVIVGVPGDGLAFLEKHGHIPLPPYIDRDDAEADRDRYQTMFAHAPGAVAAPTAGLHMTPAIAEAMTARGITLTTVTLHVGWGTFAPIRVEDVREHQMHRERYVIGGEVAALVASGRPIVALGTTALRALESAATGTRTVEVGSGATNLFVHPGSGHAWKVVDHLITNFHLPASTLLMLVCAFAGTEPVIAAYEHAVRERYRFFSYGDAMLLHRR